MVRGIKLLMYISFFIITLYSLYVMTFRTLLVTMSCVLLINDNLKNTQENPDLACTVKNSVYCCLLAKCVDFIWLYIQGVNCKHNFFFPISV